MPTSSRLIAVDPSLTCSGWAVFGLPDGGLLSVGKLKSLPTRYPLADRIRDLQDRIDALLERLELGPTDLLVAEAPTTMRDPRAAIKVEQVRGLFETLARGRGVRVPGRLNPRTVHYELLGVRGRQAKRSDVKEMAIQVVMKLFPDALRRINFEPTVEHFRRHQDVVDALLLGYLAVSRVRSASQSSSDLTDFFQGRNERR